MQEQIDGKHLTELLAADRYGMLPDAYDALNVLVNALARTSLAGCKETIDVRPKIEDVKASEEIPQRINLTWQM